MEGELEAISQQLLKHYFQLPRVGLTLHIGPRNQVVLLRFDPFWCARDLPGL
jgi:hypothetical protein